VIVAALAGSAALLAQSPSASTYATVLNDQDGPVRGLQAGDLVLRDGGVRQGVVGAEAARDPLSVAFVVHGLSAADLATLAPALDAAAARLVGANAATQVALVTAEPTVARIAPGQTAWRAALHDLAASPAAPNLVDAILRGCDALDAAPPDRRTVIAIVTPQAALADHPERLSAAVTATHVAVWTVEVGAPGAPAVAKPLDSALADATRLGGSLRGTATSGDEARAQVAAIVDCLLSQYLVTYEWPDPMLSTFSLVTRHDAGRVLTPAWSK
jgi:hypothetical protein